MITKKSFLTISWILFALFSLWWILIQFLNLNETPFNGDLFADLYGILALWGAVVGFIASQNWGGYKSYVGKAVSFFSWGLLFQFLGQLSYTIIYRVSGVENAYPSVGEIFFVLTIPSYIFAVFYLAKSSGITITLKKFSSKVSALFIPTGLVFLSYLLFLKNYSSEGSAGIGLYLDYFYPLAQACFVSLAILTYRLTRKTLGGIMKNKVTFILFSLVFQYFADSMFIYETRAETWLPGGTSDYLFVISYFLMTIGLLRFYEVYKELQTKA
ncbi:hypothetical protein L6255_03360 [Candidatus Parcubacteria bacterium]|nr:hypothetical protein [Patescibacteria group bacterium]MBU4380933.1 hypothetical protein [Patescibacteria group bacterium]MCG2689451.1 hypothetical protein [Candidatus Parcubacteria bacterium]